MMTRAGSTTQSACDVAARREHPSRRETRDLSVQAPTKYTGDPYKTASMPGLTVASCLLARAIELIE
jgi:hypothetical protein